MGVLGLATLPGCATASQVTSRARAQFEKLMGEAAPKPIQPWMGPEPAGYDPPRPVTVASTGAKGTTVTADVCVVGGGAAGMAAATAAAREGAETILLEESFVLGGNVTRGLVNLDKIAYGGEPMVAGYFSELIDGLIEQGAAVRPTADIHYAVPADADQLRHYALHLARTSGVDVRFGASAIGAERAGGRIIRVRAVQQGHPLDVRAGVFLDCTGDGNLGHLAGCPYWFGDRKHGQIQGQTLMFHAGPVDFTRLLRHARATNQHLITDYQIVGFEDLTAYVRESYPKLGRIQNGMLLNRNISTVSVSVSVSEVYGDHLQLAGGSAVLSALQEQNRVVHAHMRDLIPGFERSDLIRMAERPYLREGRRLIGYHQLTGREIVTGHKPEDSVARGWYPIDLHVRYAGGPVHLGRPPHGDWYGIPYRCIVARDVDNLLMAGRCISVTHEALGSTRISPTSMAVGQAAGIAAALSARGRVRPADLPAAEVQGKVLQAGGLI